MRRTQRLFAIAEYLRARRTGTTAEQIADRFGVTQRTVYRDLAALRDAELPLNAERGPGGGFALDRAYSLPPVNFSAAEAASLVALGSFALGSRLFPFEETLGRALDKVQGALSQSAQRELLAVARTLSFIGVPAHSASAPVRAAVEQAWLERHPLLVRYLGASGEETTRVVRIRAVVMDRTHTLLNTTDLGLGEERQLRLDRVLRAEVVAARDLEGTLARTRPARP